MKSFVKGINVRLLQSLASHGERIAGAPDHDPLRLKTRESSSCGSDRFVTRPPAVERTRGSKKEIRAVDPRCSYVIRPPTVEGTRGWKQEIRAVDPRCS